MDKVLDISPTKANSDEFCENCGYPFDSGDFCYLDEREEFVYCSKRCIDSYAVHMGCEVRM